MAESVIMNGCMPHRPRGPSGSHRKRESSRRDDKSRLSGRSRCTLLLAPLFGAPVYSSENSSDFSQGPGRDYMARVIHTMTNPLFFRRGANRVFPERLGTQRRSVSCERLLKCPSLHLPYCSTLKTIHCIPSRTGRAIHVDTIISR